MSTSTAQQHAEAAAESKTAAVVALVLFPVAVYVAVWVLHLGAVGAVGFTVAVPSLIGTAVAALTRADA